MKKLLLSVAVLAVAASCSKNEEVSVPQGDVIGFATLNNRVTKVANTNDDNSNNNYQVYAKSSVSTDTDWLINEEIATDDTYVSGNIYYWPQSPATVDFYAYAPVIATDSPLTVGTVAYGTPAIPLTFTVPAKADIDFTVATPITGITHNTATSTDGAGEVQLKFAHMLSKASLKVALDTKLTSKHTLTFTKAEFTTATNIVKADAVTATPTGASSGATATYEFTCTADEDDNTQADYNQNYTSSNALFFAPKATSATGYSIKLSGVVIATKEGSTIYSGDLTYNIAETTLFEQGKAYSFNVTVNTNATDLITITFASDDIDWVNGSDVALNTAN